MMPASNLALITGASSGIGAEFARQLAAQGYNLILTARRQANLTELADSLQLSHNTLVEIIVADLATDTGLHKVLERIRNQPDINLLVNNAGFGTHNKFAEVETEKNAAMLQVHVTASVLFTHAALSGMLANRKGVIINVSSLAGLIPIRSVMYGSTKTFLVNFSEALQVELHGTGVKIQALCPGFTYSEFHDTPQFAGFQRRKIPAILWLTSEQVVRESLGSLRHRKVICIPGFQYKIIAIFTRNRLASFFIRRIGTRLFHK